MDGFIEIVGDMTQNYLSGAFLSSAYSTAFGMNYLEMLNQQLQLFPTYQQKQYVQLRHYLVDKLAAIFSAHPDNFIEGDLGETRESFKRLDEML